MTFRSYGDPCGLARALDRVGERWALLVVRELMLGPRRFSDLRAGLPGASPNVLSQRLRELEDSELVERRTLPPPAGSTVYELTARGRDLAPAVRALAKWGSRARPIPRGELGATSLMVALETTFRPTTLARGRLALVIGGEPYRAAVARKQLSITRAPCEAPDATITGSARALRDVVFASRPPSALELAGDTVLARRFLAAFERPPG